MLFVEDEPLVMMNGVDVLMDAGFEVVEAQNGEEALAAFEARGDIRAVFTDVNMPGSLDGIRLAHAIHARSPGTVIIVTSGAMRPAEGELPPEARFISKPYRAEALVQGISALLGSA